MPNRLCKKGVGLSYLPTPYDSLSLTSTRSRYGASVINYLLFKFFGNIQTKDHIYIDYYYILLLHIYICKGNN